VLSSGAEVHVPLAELIDLDRERERLRRQASELESLVERSAARLASDDFLRKAPAQVVEQARQKLASLREQLGKVQQRRKVLEAP
jgi:valyl-tRNA synthetase